MLFRLQFKKWQSNDTCSYKKNCRVTRITGALIVPVYDLRSRMMHKMIFLLLLLLMIFYL